ncbi:MAG: type II toxin-antitoxin system VapC family toxin [Gammaproteobacteria bacterium]|nr:type II toxin-antitoxin system VapC family toxin [Gammaproteobacteria bacterium]
MIFVDTNVIMYAVGRAHPLKAAAREFFETALADQTRLCTSAEVLQELLHAYLPVGRMQTWEDALTLVQRLNVAVWPLESADVIAAGALQAQFPALDARDLCHLASCRRREVAGIKTYDRALASVSA